MQCLLLLQINILGHLFHPHFRQYKHVNMFPTHLTTPVTIKLNSTTSNLTSTTQKHPLYTLHLCTNSQSGVFKIRPSNPVFTNASLQPHFHTKLLFTEHSGHHLCACMDLAVMGTALLKHTPQYILPFEILSLSYLWPLLTRLLQ
jgi:hypothetical protein